MINYQTIGAWCQLRLKRLFILTLGLSLIIQLIVLPAPAEATIAFRGPSSFNATSGTSRTLGPVAGTIENEVMVAILATSGNPGTVTAPAGWTAVGSACTGGSGESTTTFRVWWRAFVAGDTTWNWSWTNSEPYELSIGTYEGVDKTNPIHATPGTFCLGGTGTALSANSITTTVTNTRVVGIWTAGNANTGTTINITPTSATERFANAGNYNYSCGTFCTNTARYDYSASDSLQATAATFSKAATTNISTSWVGTNFALNPAALPTLSQSSYRLMQNLDSADPTYLFYDPTDLADDTVRDIAVDSDNGFYYVGGSSTVWTAQKRRIDDSSVVSWASGGCAISVTGGLFAMAIDTADNAVYLGGDDTTGGGRWRVEKRSLSDGCLVSAFGASGVYTYDPTVGADSIFNLVVDPVNHYLFIGGYDSDAGDSWRITKISTTDAGVDNGFGASGHIDSNISAGLDRVRVLNLDIGGGYVYAGGWDGTNTNTQWRVEKRKMTTGNLCTAAECGTQFGTNGVYTTNITSGNDRILAMLLDAAGNALYLGGFDSSTGADIQWRIEKLAADTGAIVTGFGASGVVTHNPSSGNDRLLDFALDGTGGYIYTTGQEDIGGSDIRWRTEKRNRSDGSLVSTFGTNGVITSNPSVNDDSPARIIVDLPRNIIFTAGGDRVEGISDQRWRIEKYDLNTGTIWLGDEDTIGIASTNITFRLRMLLDVSVNNMYTNDNTLKLKTSIKDGTCDTAGVGEVYNDVATGSGQIRYHNNVSVAESATLIGVTGDPTHGAHNSIIQTIEESNNFTNSVGDVIAGQDGIWDFVLKDVDAFGAYCFMVTRNDNSAIATPIIVPEITFCRNEPRTENLLRGGTYFCEGTKRSFFWAKE